MQNSVYCNFVVTATSILESELLPGCSGVGTMGTFGVQYLIYHHKDFGISALILKTLFVSQ